ncbi:hypothetical protein RQP46_000164 [Phenoliferia psychrophenolica]
MLSALCNTLLAFFLLLLRIYLFLVALEFLINLEQKYANKKSGIKRGVPPRRASLWFRRPTWAELGQSEIDPSLFHLPPRGYRARLPILPTATPLWRTTPPTPPTYSINGFQLPPPGSITKSGHLQPYLAASEIAQVEAQRAQDAGKSEEELRHEEWGMDMRYRRRCGMSDPAEEWRLERIALGLPVKERSQVVAHEDSNVVAEVVTPSSPVELIQVITHDYSNASASASAVVELETPLPHPAPATHLDSTPSHPFVPWTPVISESAWVAHKLLILNGAAPLSGRPDPSSWPLNGCNHTYYSSPSLFPADWMVPKQPLSSSYYAEPSYSSIDYSRSASFPAPSPPPPAYSTSFPTPTSDYIPFPTPSPPPSYPSLSFDFSTPSSSSAPIVNHLPPRTLAMRIRARNLAPPAPTPAPKVEKLSLHITERTPACQTQNYTRTHTYVDGPDDEEE